MKMKINENSLSSREQDILLYFNFQRWGIPPTTFTFWLWLVPVKALVSFSLQSQRVPPQFFRLSPENLYSKLKKPFQADRTSAERLPLYQAIIPFTTVIITGGDAFCAQQHPLVRFQYLRTCTEATSVLWTRWGASVFGSVRSKVNTQSKVCWMRPL